MSAPMRRDEIETTIAGWREDLQSLEGTAETVCRALIDALAGEDDAKDPAGFEMDDRVAEVVDDIAAKERATAGVVDALALDEIAQGPVPAAVFANADQAVAVVESHRAVFAGLAASLEEAVALQSKQYLEDFATLSAMRVEKRRKQAEREAEERRVRDALADTARLLANGEKLFRALNRHLGSCDIVRTRLMSELEHIVLLHAAAGGMPAAPNSCSGALFALNADGLLNYVDTRRRLDAAREAFAARFSEDEA